MLFDLPQYLRRHIFKLSRKAALCAHLDDHLRSRPRSKQCLNCLGRDYIGVSFRLSIDKTMEIEYNSRIRDTSVSILKQDTVLLLVYEKDEQLVCQLCMLNVLRWWQGASFPSSTWFAS